jgi:hypothetical protein
MKQPGIVRNAEGPEANPLSVKRKEISQKFSCIGLLDEEIVVHEEEGRG